MDGAETVLPMEFISMSDIRRFKIEKADVDVVLASDCEALEREIERLGRELAQAREALRKIVDNPDCRGASCWEIARAALSAAKGTE